MNSISTDICLDLGLVTPKKPQQSEHRTPRRSERKRALFPTNSPQTSDLGHFSPLNSSPDRYSSAPNTPDSVCNDRDRIGSNSPFGRQLNSASRQASKITFADVLYDEVTSKILDDVPSLEQLDETIVSAMDQSDGVQSPKTPGNQDVQKKTETTRPLTPAKRRSVVPMETDNSDSSPTCSDGQRKSPAEGASKNSDKSRARTSLFSEKQPTAKRFKYSDNIYLTGRNKNKNKRTFGAINNGVRTGIKRPGKMRAKAANKKSKHTKPENVTKTRGQEDISPNKKVTHHSRKKQTALPESIPMPREPSPEPDLSKRFIKRPHRSAVITVNKNIKIQVSRGKFTLQRAEPSPPIKRRRKLFNPSERSTDISCFDDTEPSVPDCTRNQIENILHILDKEEDGAQNNQFHQPQNIQPVQDELPVGNQIMSPVRSLTSPPDANFMSPLSELASSTKSLRINIGSDTLHLNTAKVKEWASGGCLLEDDVLTSDSNMDPLIFSEADFESCRKENESSLANAEGCNKEKLFPIFTRTCNEQKHVFNSLPSGGFPKSDKSQGKVWKPLGNDQYQIDAGQKRFGETICTQCGLLYQLGDPDDELVHEKHHNYTTSTLKYTGWKNENVVGMSGQDRIILVKPGDSKVWWNKVKDVLQIVDAELGFVNVVMQNMSKTKVYFYVSNKTIVGCLVAERRNVANRMQFTEEETGGVDCCSVEEYPILCGVSRIWVCVSHRRRNIATELMNCMRKNFLFGHVLAVDEIAFSSPTTSGKMFAQKYTGHKNYYVYTSAEV